MLTSYHSVSKYVPYMVGAILNDYFDMRVLILPLNIAIVIQLLPIALIRFGVAKAQSSTPYS